MISIQVLKRTVDGYEEGKVIPKCQFSAKVMLQEGEDVPPLQHQVELRGAKSPNNILAFDINPPSGVYTTHINQYAVSLGWVGRAPF